MILLSLIFVLIKSPEGGYIFEFYRFIVLFSMMLPISLKINLLYARRYFEYCITSDSEIECQTNFTAPPDELGRIEYL